VGFPRRNAVKVFAKKISPRTFAWMRVHARQFLSKNPFSSLHGFAAEKIRIMAMPKQQK
jgi:hypothetical protein